MNEGDEEKLVILLEARLTDLERNMAKASGTTARRFREMSLHSKTATKQMEQDAIRSTTRINQAFATVSTKIGEYGRAFASNMFAGATLSVAGFATAAKAAVESTAELSRQARMAGVDVEAFQELKFVAEQNKIGIDALADGLKEMNLRADEFIATGAGGGAEAFQRLGYSSEELATKIKKPSDLFVEIIGRMQQFERAAQIRIGDELFGGSAGERFVELVEQGAEGLQENIKLAREMGIVMDAGMVKQAEETDKKINILASTIGTKLKKEVLEVAQGFLLFWNSFQEFEQQSDKRVRGALGDVYTKLDAAKQNLADLEQVNMGTPADAINIRQAREEVERLTDEAMKLRDILDRRQGYNPNGQKAAPAPFVPKDTSSDYMRSYREELAKTNRERQIASETEKILADASSKGATLTREQAAALAAESVARSERDAAAKKSTSESERSAKAAEKEREKVAELIADLEKEIALVWASDEAKRAASASREAGAAATESERQKIIALNEALYQEEEARRKADEAMLYYRDLTRAGLDDLFGALEQGKSFWQAMGDVAVKSLKRIADTMLDDVLDSIFKVNGAASGRGGGGFLSSLFSGIGSLFGGGKFPSAPGGLYANGGAFAGGVQMFANGGAFTNSIVDKPTLFPFAKGTGLMGEAGPEAIMPLTRDGSGRLGVSALGGGQAKAAMSVSVPVSIIIDATGSDEAGLARVERQLAQLKSSLPSTIVDTVKQANLRRMW
ncbi:hypothetical protein QE369_001202 [Agrobacterium larrymoorei]|uniref:Phage tail tape measure protein n=1 Tax=Agrobacterium larrymoorei TaxID=160699 RepID=A0AAJ2B860_9HYPH|nr:tail tape measure protein [Agrobacterium larrymoorei]MDR6101024.1 hypothetical protein [Agrobacterium larrymoorei]